MSLGLGAGPQGGQATSSSSQVGFTETGAPDAARPGALMTEVLGVLVAEGAGPSLIARESPVRAASRSPRCPRWRPWRDSSPSRTANRRPPSPWPASFSALFHTLFSWRRCTAGQAASTTLHSHTASSVPHTVRRRSAPASPGPKFLGLDLRSRAFTSGRVDIRCWLRVCRGLTGALQSVFSGNTLGEFDIFINSEIQSRESPIDFPMSPPMRLGFVPAGLSDGLQAGAAAVLFGSFPGMNT